MPNNTSTLERRLGPLDAAAIIIANVIGGGSCFFRPSLRPTCRIRGGSSPRGWLGRPRFCGAMAYAELAALRPRAGGEYVYLREAYGSLADF